MKNLFALILVFMTGFSIGKACDPNGPDGEDLLKKATSIVDEATQQSFSSCGTSADKKISVASVLPLPDEKNVVITFTINEENKIHVVEVQGGYAFINHYIKTSLEGKEIKTENAIPGINYVMTVKLPTSV
ncbi:MAG: hypothetical protein ACHQFW_08065 [Chitinophagales bacterium]